MWEPLTTDAVENNTKNRYFRWKARWSHGGLLVIPKQGNQIKLESASSKQKQLTVARRKPFYLHNEEVLLEWVHERRSNGKWWEGKQGFSTMTNARKWIFLQHSRQAVGGYRSSWPEWWVMHTAHDNRIPKGSLVDKLILYVLQTRRLRIKFSHSDSDIKAMNTRHAFQHNCRLHRPQHYSYENNTSREGFQFA